MQMIKTENEEQLENANKNSGLDERNFQIHG